MKRFLKFGFIWAALGAAAFVVAVPAAQAYHRHKPHCHAGAKPKRIRIHVRKHGHRKTIRAWKCVKNPHAPLASMGAEPSPSLFGIDTSTYDSSHANFVNDFPTAQGLGSRWDRFTLQPNDATGNYATIDYEVTQARKHGMGAILSFGGIQSACSMSTSKYGGCPPTTSGDLSNYESYVERILTRYHNVVDYYESWVEENHGSQWGGTVNPAQYAALLKAQYQAFHTFNSQHPNSGPGGSNMKLLFGSTNGFVAPSGGIAALPFVDAVLGDLGGATAFDGIALHAYRFGEYIYGPNDPAPDDVGTLSYPSQDCVPSAGTCQMTWSQELSAYEQEFTNHGYGQPPMWLTEFGWPGSAQSNGAYYPSDEEQDTNLKDAYADLLRLPFIKGALWFNLRDYKPGLSTPDPAWFYHFGLLNYDYSPKSAGTDFKSLVAANPGR